MRATQVVCNKLLTPIKVKQAVSWPPERGGAVERPQRGLTQGAIAAEVWRSKTVVLNFFKKFKTTHKDSTRSEPEDPIGSTRDNPRPRSGLSLVPAAVP